MKKYASALALAAVMAVPAAQAAEVSITGYVSAGVAHYSYDDEPAGRFGDSETRIDDGRYSRFRFTAVEELPNGMKADIMIEQRFFAEDALASGRANGNSERSDVGNGNVWVGLAGDFGKISLGRVDTYYSDGVLVEISRATAFASYGTLSLLSQYNGAYLAGAGRHANQIRYDTPNFNGFSATLAYSTGKNEGGEGDAYLNGDDDLDRDSFYVSGRYLKGPIYAGFSYFDEESVRGAADVKAYRVYGSYTLPMGLKIGASIDQSELDGDDRLAWFVPVTYKVGSHAFYAGYGQADDIDGTSDTGAKMWNLGYDYGFSARTSIGINYTVIDNDDAGLYRPFLGGVAPNLGGNATFGDPGVKITQIYLGLAHVF